jgi:hypothetical protein
MTAPRYRVQEKPSISANQLAAYLVSTTTAQKRIIRDAHYQSRIIVSQYKDAREAITQFLASPVRDHKILERAKELLNKKAESPSTKAAMQDFYLRQVAAIEEFQRGLNQFQIGGLTFRLPSRHRPLSIEGVDVKVTIDAIVEAVSRPGSKFIGGLILQASKGDGSGTEAALHKRKEMGLYAATLVHLYASEHLADQGEPSWRHCFALDVHKRALHAAPRTYAQRAQHISDACFQIAVMWDRVDPPAAYIFD